MKVLQHFWTITKHKYYVLKFCWKCGEYKLGLLHDNSKFSYVEFWNGVKYFQGNNSPIDAEIKEKGYSLAWQHHKGHNPHHWEYWMDGLTPIKIPFKFLIEMICDWLSCSIVYEKRKIDYDAPYSQPWDFYQIKKKTMVMHPESCFIIETFLKIIRDKGVNYFCKNVKNGYIFLEGLNCLERGNKNDRIDKKTT